MFVCALRPIGEPLRRADLFRYIARLRDTGTARQHVTEEGVFSAAVVASPAPHRPQAAQWNALQAVGDVRLDNREEMRRLAGVPVPTSASDLEVALAALDACGEACIPRLLGDFGFVVWDGRGQKLLAIRDAFGVKPLYYTAAAGALALASRADVLAMGERLDADFVAEFLVGLNTGHDRTVWKDVFSVPAGSYLIQRGTHREVRRYWSAGWFAPADDVESETGCDAFRDLLRDAVQARLGASGTTWAQLSGGLDSSTVAAMAQLVGGGRGLAGTITIVDTLGNGDERRYADTLIRRYELRNEQVRDYWAWQDDGAAPPVTDTPQPLYPFFARDRRMYETIRGAGGRVLLSGLGSDHYLHGNLYYIADLAARGKLGAAFHEVLRWSVISRQSFWTLARQHLVGPFLPRRRRGQGAYDVPDWIEPAFAAATRLEARLPEADLNTDPRGEKFTRQVARDVAALSQWIERTPFSEEIELRYPFLHRPLVEAALRLPARARVRPAVHKWVLREATRGVLPEEIRTRSTKGSIDARILWSLQHERARVDELVRDPVLAQLGFIRPEALRDAVESARRGVVRNSVYLMSALSLETWLSVRLGRWAVHPHAAPNAA